jgi:phospholipid/cholesterol/gamma-HCH transport system substrate-binding protein
MSRRVLVNLVFFNAVFLVMLIWAAQNIITIDAIERPYEITGDFAGTSGVLPDAEVTYLGVHHGRVSTVERIPEGVRITMKIDRGKEIPSESIARIFRKSAIGEPYIDFVPSDEYDERTTTPIEPGDHVPIERTTVPLEFSELLRSASDLIASIEPETVSSLLHELSAALDGRGEALRTITTSMDDLTSTFVERTEQLDRLAENNTRLVSVLADHRLSLGASMSDLRALTETLQRIDGEIDALLAEGPEFLRTTADLVADQKQNLDCLLSDLDPILRTLAGPDQLDQLSHVLARGPLAFGYAAASIDQEADGPWVRVNLLAGLEGEPAEQYVPPRSLPAVPTVPACDSPLVAASVTPATPSRPGHAAGAAPDRPAAEPGDEAAAPEPATAGEDRSPGPLAVTGAAVALALAVVAIVGGLALWRARRLPDPTGR